MRKLLLKDFETKEQVLNIDTQDAVSQDDINLIQLFAEREYTNSNIQKLCFTDRKRITGIFKKLNCNSFENCLRNAIVSGLIPDNLSQTYRKYIFKTAAENIRKKLKYDREITHILCNIPVNFSFFLRDAEEYISENNFKLLKLECRQILKDKDTLDFLEKVKIQFNLDDKNKRKDFFNHIYRYFRVEKYPCAAKTLTTYFKNYEFIDCLFLAFHYKDEIENVEMNLDFNSREIDILRFLCFKGDLYDAEQKFHCSDFISKFLESAKTDNFQTALHIFLLYINHFYDSVLDFIEKKQKNECHKILDKLFQLYNDNLDTVFSNNDNRLIIESAIMHQYYNITRDHEFKPYANVISRINNRLNVDVLGLVTNKWKETKKQRIKRYYHTSKALERIHQKILQ